MTKRPVLIMTDTAFEALDNPCNARSIGSLTTMKKNDGQVSDVVHVLEKVLINKVNVKDDELRNLVKVFSLFFFFFFFFLLCFLFPVSNSLPSSGSTIAHPCKQ